MTRRPLRPARAGTPGLAIVACTVLALAACGAGDDARPDPRPVLVERPGEAATGSVAFAGEVRAREEAVLAFRVGGKLVARHADIGDAVRRGALLAELDPGDLRLQAGALSAQLSAARAQLARATAERDRLAELAADQLVSATSLEAAEAAHAAALGQVRALDAELDVARNQAAYAQLRAPADGAIAARHAEAGQVVAAGQPVYTLAADAGREVVIAIPEGRVDDVVPGMPAEVELWRTPGRRLAATVREVAPVADPTTRTWEARVALRPEDARGIALGQTARVHLPRDGEAGGLSVPLAAVQQAGDGGTAVWVVDPATQAVALVPVVLGDYGSERVPVREGLAPDALVVAAGGHLLQPGQVVQPVDRDNRPVE